MADFTLCMLILSEKSSRQNEHSWCMKYRGGRHILNQVTHCLLFLSTAVTAKLYRRRLPMGDPEFEIDGHVEFIRQGPLLPYDTQHLLQQWLLINLRCANTLVRSGRAQLYLLTGTVQPDGSVVLDRLFPWHKKDVNIASATRKWRHYRC